MEFVSFAMQNFQHKTYEETMVGEIDRARHIQKSVPQSWSFRYIFFPIRIIVNTFKNTQYTQHFIRNIAP